MAIYPFCADQSSNPKTGEKRGSPSAELQSREVGRLALRGCASGMATADLPAEGAEAPVTLSPLPSRTPRSSNRRAGLGCAATQQGQSPRRGSPGAMGAHPPSRFPLARSLPQRDARQRSRRARPRQEAARTGPAGAAARAPRAGQRGVSYLRAGRRRRAAGAAGRRRRRRGARPEGHCRR